MVHLGEDLVGQGGGGDGLRAVTRPCEGDQQRGQVLGEAPAGVGDEVRGGNRVDAPPQVPCQGGLEHLAGERGGPGAGEHHTQVAACHERIQERVQRFPGGSDDPVDLPPQGGLLGDLTDGVDSAVVDGQRAGGRGHTNSLWFWFRFWSAARS